MGKWVAEVGDKVTGWGKVDEDEDDDDDGCFRSQDVVVV